MKSAIKYMSQIVIAIWISFSAMSIVANWIPWYTQDLPLKVDSNKYYASQKAKTQIGTKIRRKSLFGMKALNTIELVHMHNNEEREIYKYTKNIYLQKGSGVIEVFYDIPAVSKCAQLETNTYKFRGIITYNPFGFLDKSFEWETEEFQIEVKPKKT